MDHVPLQLVLRRLDFVAVDLELQDDQLGFRLDEEVNLLQLGFS